MNQALVTGATGAIGGALARHLVQAGYEVWAVGRSVERLASLGDLGPTLRPLALDLEDPATAAALRDAVGPRLDLLAHAAGAYEQASFGDGDDLVLRSLFSLNVEVPWRLTRALLPALLAASGEVVFVNSSVRAGRGLAPYAAAKQALRALADGLRAEVNEHGVRVLSVYPGRTAGTLQQQLFAAEGREYLAERLLQPDDVAAAILAALALPRTAECTDLHLRPFSP